MRDPQVTMGCNSKSWSKDLDDLGYTHGLETSTCLKQVWFATPGYRFQIPEKYRR
jgi:hypothetical protein